jgi:thiol-disulfide isomerase/thioredoxin
MVKPVVTATLRRRIVAGLLLLLGVAVVAVGSAGRSSLGTSSSALPAESFALFDGGNATLASFSGKPLVVNFWASWCPACVAELPELQAVHEQFGDQVTIVGLANTDIRSEAAKLADEVGLSYTLADDPAGDIFRELGLIAMPSTVFISADGQIQSVFGGQLSQEGLSERIQTLVGSP